MTDGLNNSQTTESFSSNNLAQPAPSAPMVSPSVESTPVSEKMLPQSEVNRLVGEVKNKSYERGWQEAQTQWQRQPAPHETSAQLGGMTSMTPDALERAAEQLITKKLEERDNYAKQQEIQNQANKLAYDIDLKMQSVRTKYSDFDQVVSPSDMAEIANVLVYANLVDNTGDVVYHLMKDPAQLLNVNQAIANATTPFMQKKALQLMQTISSSIKGNQQAVQQQPNANPPLSQVKPSNVGVDTGSKTIQDLRRQSWLRV